jgi:hypothetical protein
MSKTNPGASRKHTLYLFSQLSFGQLVFDRQSQHQSFKQKEERGNGKAWYLSGPNARWRYRYQFKGITLFSLKKLNET